MPSVWLHHSAVLSGIGSKIRWFLISQHSHAGRYTVVEYGLSGKNSCDIYFGSGEEKYKSVLQWIEVQIKLIENLPIANKQEAH
jgi:hypothetical protein